MKVINNFRRTIKFVFINHLLVKSAFVSEGWMIVSCPCVAPVIFHPLRMICGEALHASRHKTATRSRPNESFCSLFSVLCGFISVTLLMHYAFMKEINTTSLRPRGCNALLLSPSFFHLSFQHIFVKDSLPLFCFSLHPLFCYLILKSPSHPLPSSLPVPSLFH